MLAKKFEDQVERTPGNIAVKTVEKTYTYSQLNRYANGIAALISGAAAGDTVGLLFEHGVHMIAAILGALKAGKIYVPLSVYYPENRLSYMLSDSESALLVTGTAHAAAAARLAQKVNIPVLTIETDSKEPAAPGKNLQNPVRDISDDSTAYILYTSGSTGKPKGVLQTLHNTDYYTRHWIREFSITSTDRMTLIPSFCHDASVQDIFSALHTGAALFPFHLRNRESTMDLSEFLKKEKITIWHSVPSLYSYFVNTLTGRETFPELRWIVLGGELVRQQEVEMFNRYFPHSTLATIYGQTESSVNSIHVIQQGETFGKSVLGTPLDEIEMLVIDDEGEPVGPLQTGEILIGCPYISPGYQGNPELTSAVFAQDEEFGRLYWTGDLGRLLVDGSIEFLGRRDHQVKIRGFRVELEEIETCLLQHPWIQEAVVTLREERVGDKYLCAYTVCAESAGEAINARQLRDFLSQELPDYMIPASFVTLERMPRTPNGKIDRKALPEPEIKERDEFIAPSGDIEKKLAGIWAEVLGIKKGIIGVDGNFFELGGHSLKAARLTSEVHKAFDVNVPLAEIFKSSTIRELAAYIKKAKKDIYEEIQRLEKRDYYPQSSAQKRLFFLDKFEDIGVSYNMPALFKIEGKMDKKRYENTFAALITRHESLRTSFYLLDNEPVQIVHDQVDFEIEYYAAGQTGHNLEVVNIIERFIRPFDLARAPLLRLGIVEISAQASLLLFDMHHIISDGASIGILAENFARIYNGEEQVPPKIQYKDYAGWQDGLYKTGKIRRQEEFWLNRYPDSLTIPRLNLPTDFPRPGVFSYEGITYRFTLGAEDTLRLIQMDAVCEATLYMKLLALFNVLLYKYTGQEDIIIGSGIEGRHHAAVKPLIGLFVNMLAMRNCPEGGKTFQEFLEEIKIFSINAFENQDVQFEALIEQLALERDISRNPLFDAALFLQNFARPDIDIGMKGIRLTACKCENKTSKFDMTLYAWEKDDKIEFSLEYYTKLFKIETIKRLTRHFINVTRQVCRNPGIRLSRIDIKTAEEKQRIISDFNNTNVPFPAEKTVHRLIEEQVDKNPHQTAAVMANSVSMRNEALTYKALNEQANRLARLLRDKGIDRDRPAAVLCERSLEMLIGILGVLKAGGAYIPVDINFPIERIKTILAESGTRIVLTTSASFEDMPERLYKFSMDRYPGLEMSEILDRGAINTYSKENLKEINQANDLCYVAYTSGSSGKPKGVMIEHRNVVNFIEGMASKIDFSSRKVILCVTTISFDIFVLETLLPLVKGLRMIMADEVQQRDPDLMEDLIIKHHVGLLQLTPSRLKLWTGQRDNRFLMEIEALIVGGEVFPIHLYESLRNKYQGNIYNVYGPTETTVWSTLKDLKGVEKMNIGGPISNTRIYILDESDGVQPIGIEGELCIGGEGVARGYLNNPELTAEKFDQDFQDDQDDQNEKEKRIDKNPLTSLPLYPSTSLYRTGDRARWLPNGEIEFAGRVDRQVKIRGYRIELGEISGRLSKHDDIKEAAVIAKEDEEGDNYLCAYIVPLPGKEPDISGLKAYLAQELPAYMIPSYVVSIDRIPLTASGKLDRQSLPEPRGGTTGERYAAPRDEIEKTLVGIWSEVLLLNKESVSMNDHFFESGGHSLKAAALTAKIHETFQVKMPLAEIFKRPVLSGISEYIKEAGAENHRTIEPVEEKEYYPLSSAQKRLYVLYLMEKESVGYNLPAIMELEGNLDTRRMETAFKGLIERHESFRTSFEILNGELMQKVQKRHECRPFAIERSAGPGGVPVNPDMGLRHCRFYHSFIRPFDLSCAPLLRVGLIKIEEKHHLLILDMHHIISDGISLGILRREFMALYAAQALPPLKLQYKDYSDWHNKEKDQNAVRIREKYWLEQFAGDIPRLHLPYDFPRPIVKSSAGSQEGFEITGRELEVLKKQALENEATLFMVLLAVFTAFLSRISSQEEIVVGTPTAGRRHVNVENIVGIFINTLALRNTILPTSKETFRTVVREVRRRTLEAFDNQDYPFEDLVEQVVETRDTSRSPLFDVMFVMQNMDRVDIHLPGITLRPYPSPHTMTAFDLVLIAGERPGKLVFTLRYCTGLFKRETILRLIRYFKTLLRILPFSPDIPLTNVDIIGKQEKQQLLYAFNVTEVDYPKNKTIHRLFEEQVERTPDNIAAVDTGEWHMSHLTYGELEKKSNRLAGVLVKKGVTLNSIVGLMVGPSIEMVIGILGILKAGGAYLPIDPDYPNERKLYILKDSSTGILVSEVSEADKGVEVVELDEINKKSEYLPTHPFTHSPTQLCYVIYTSGTTGRPKGVLVEHKGVINYICWRLRTYGFSGNDVTLQLLSFTFDGFAANFYPPLLSGGKLILVPASKRMEFDYIKNKMKRLGVTNTSLVPALYEILLDNVHPGEMRSFRFVVLAGEKPGEQLMEKSKAKNPGVQHIIEYGPTEATVTAAANTAPDTGRTAVVGTPIANSRIYLWDNCKKLAAVGVPGELCIAGEGVARGYLNRPELTTEKFDQDFQDYQDEKEKAEGSHHSSFITHHSALYRTGDLARWLPDGNIEFLGRLDHQVKIRGFRVEPGEIVNRLVQHEDIKEAVVIDREDKNRNKYLCAYIVPNSVGAFEKTSNTAELRNYLSGKLPAYMIPAHFFKTDRIPVTTSGKIDLKALQRVEGEPVETGAVYTAPRNETEKKIRATWMEILGLEKIGIHDNFFELGGNSLDIVKLSSRLREVLAEEVPVVKLFQYPTVHSLAHYLNRQKTGDSDVDKEAEEEKLDMSEELLFDAIQLLEEG